MWTMDVARSGHKEPGPAAIIGSQGLLVSMMEGALFGAKQALLSDKG